MNILVCLKIVSQATFTDSLTDNDDRLSGGKLGINPADAYALELALRIKDNAPETMVTVVTMAPSYAENALRDAIAAGADRAVLICDSALAGSDTLVTANILAAAINRLGGFDLVLCGRKAIDSETGHIAPQLSERLDGGSRDRIRYRRRYAENMLHKRRRFGRIRRCRSGSALCLQRNGYGAQPDRHGHAPKQKSRHRAPYACRHRNFRRNRRPARRHAQRRSRP